LVGNRGNNDLRWVSIVCRYCQLGRGDRGLSFADLWRPSGAPLWFVGHVRLAFTVGGWQKTARKAKVIHNTPRTTNLPIGFRNQAFMQAFMESAACELLTACAKQQAPSIFSLGPLHQCLVACRLKEAGFELVDLVQRALRLSIRSSGF
jgi:hypothetical protein